MMFIIVTHDNQGTLLSFSLFLSFVTNSPAAEKNPLWFHWCGLDCN